jgi:hypothetical protein
VSEQIPPLFHTALSKHSRQTRAKVSQPLDQQSDKPWRMCDCVSMRDRGDASSMWRQPAMTSFVADESLSSTSRMYNACSYLHTYTAVPSPGSQRSVHSTAHRPIHLQGPRLTRTCEPSQGPMSIVRPYLKKFRKILYQRPSKHWLRLVQCLLGSWWCDWAVSAFKPPLC